MQTGWVKDDGNWYYMDLKTGALFTGWHEISGKWYYFHEEGDGFKGTLMVNCETPDGYTVDVNGALVE
jgi:glucan-binding YG repeat protein